MGKKSASPIDVVKETETFRLGRVEMNDYGAAMATWRLSRLKHVGETDTFTVRLVGPIQVGVRTYMVGVIPGRKDIFLGMNGRVWRFPRRVLLTEAPAPPAKPRRHWWKYLSQWACALRESCVDRMEVAPEQRLGSAGREAYQSLVRNLVFRCILDCASFGLARTPHTLAKCVSPHWTEWDLLSPVVPTVRHALMLSLLLALRDTEAGDLLELAGFCEYRCTLITRQTGMVMYREAAQQLARLCPEWWTAGYATDWALYGSIEQRMRRQFTRIVHEAERVDSAAYAVAGVHVQAAVKRAYEEQAHVRRETSEATKERIAKLRAWHAMSREEQDVLRAQRAQRAQREERQAETHTREEPPPLLGLGMLSLHGSGREADREGSLDGG